MEQELWKAIVVALRKIDRRFGNPAATYSDERIVCVWFWAVIHDRPVSWACDRKNWTPHLRRQKVPSSATMSRRLRLESVRQLIKQLEQRILRPDGKRSLVWYIDGKPLVIGGASKDRQAGNGRAVRGMARGYKLHAIFGADYSVAAWRIAPMNVSEKVIGRRLIRSAAIHGYLVGDGNYEAAPLHELCMENGDLQLVARRRKGRGLGHRRQCCGRLRSIELLEHSLTGFGPDLLQERDAIERFFGRLSSWGGGLTHLPAWARTHRRVHRWVQAKLILTALKRDL